MAGESWKSHKNTTRERDLERDHADQLDDFDLWLDKVDRLLRVAVGVRHSDVADRDWRAEFEAGESPESVVDQALRDEIGGGFRF